MKPIYIVDGARTPFLKSRNRPGPFSAADLATQAGRTLLVRQPFAPKELDEVILGCAAPSVDEVNIGRVAALRMGCGQRVPGWTVMRNCASGMQAVDSGINNILAGRSKLVLAGGVDALSRAPLLYGDKMVLWFSDMAAARTTGQRLKLFARLPVGAVLKPVIGIMKGLTDPMVGLLMGQTAENLAYRFGITRTEMDAFAVRSHHRVAAAQAAGHLAPGGGEVEALYDANGKAYALDDEEKGLQPIGRIVDSEWAGLDPAQMGLGPVHAATPILKRNGLGLNDLDYWEINEAFAAQVLGCLAAWKDEKYCREELGLDGALGALDEEKLNVDGGAIALGHPVGASGTRIGCGSPSTSKASPPTPSRARRSRNCAARCAPSPRKIRVASSSAPPRTASSPARTSKSSRASSRRRRR